MAESREVREALQSFADAILKQSSSSSMFNSRESTSRRGKTDGSSENGQDLLDQNRANNKTLQMIEKGIKQIATEGVNKKELKSIRELPAEIRKGLEESGNKNANKMAASIKTFGDVVNARDKLKAQEKLIEVLKSYEGGKVSAAGVEEIVEASKAAGVSFSRFIDENEKVIKGLDKLEEETVDLAEVFDKTTNKHTRLSRAVGVSESLFKQHSARLKQSLDMFIEETKLARERGAWDAKYGDALLKMGVSMKEWTTVLADNRNVQQAMRDGGRDFTAEMANGSSALLRYSKDNDQALRTTAAFSQNIASMGVKQKNLGGALDEQVKMYEDNYFIYGVTAEAFAKSTEQLLADVDVRQSLAMMDEKQRKQYILGMQAQEASRIALGYTTEQARELTKVFASMGAESPKERMKKAAKMRALAGSLGMGGEGQRLQDIMVNINQLQGSKKAAAIKEAEEIQRGMSNKIQERYSAGLGSEMFTRAMVDKAGFNDFSKQLQTLSQEGKVIDPEAAAAAAAGRKVPELLSKSIGIWDTISAFQGTSVGLLGSILGVLTIQTLGKGAVGAKFGSKAAAAGGGKMGAAKAAGGMALKGAAPLAAIAAGVFKYMEVADDKSLTGNQKAVQVGSTAAGAAGGMLAGAASGAAIGMFLGPVGAAIGGLIGGVAGGMGGEMLGDMLGDGISSLMDSPETKKAAEDAAKKKSKNPEEDVAKIYEKSVEKQGQQNEKLNTTMDKILTHLQNANEQSSEQTEAVKRSTETGTELLRVNAFRG